MSALLAVLPYIQIAFAILLMAGILLQHSSASAGGAFGGGEDFASGFHTKRGAEKVIFIATIIFAILFAAVSLLALILR